MSKRLIIDTNLLLLLVIGAVEGGRHIRNSKRLGDFDEKDYHIVVQLMKQYEKIYITPYIAAEVSNLIDLYGVAGKLAHQIARELFSLFEQIDSIIEDDCIPDNFLKFGITDSSLIRLVPDYDVLTNDNRMLEVLYKAGPETTIPYSLAKQAGLGSVPGV